MKTGRAVLAPSLCYKAMGINIHISADLGSGMMTQSRVSCGCTVKVTTAGRTWTELELVRDVPSLTISFTLLESAGACLPLTEAWFYSTWTGCCIESKTLGSTHSGHEGGKQYLCSQAQKLNFLWQSMAGCLYSLMYLFFFHEKYYVWYFWKILHSQCQFTF